MCAGSDVRRYLRTCRSHRPELGVIWNSHAAIRPAVGAERPIGWRHSVLPPRPNQQIQVSFAGRAAAHPKLGVIGSGLTAIGADLSLHPGWQAVR